MKAPVLPRGEKRSRAARVCVTLVENYSTQQSITLLSDRIGSSYVLSVRLPLRNKECTASHLWRLPINVRTHIGSPGTRSCPMCLH